MNIACPFVYGRTMSIDYHWMQPPAHKLRIGFFADFVEGCNHLVARGERFYFVGLDERTSVFSLALSLPGVCDRRGRPISFVFGYTVDSRNVREFAYRLPMLLKEGEGLIARYDQLVRQAVETDGQVTVAPFNPFVSGEAAAKNHRQSVLDDEEKRDFSYKNDLYRRNDLESSVRAVDGWVEKMAEEIRLRIDTPRVVSNVDVSRLGAFLDLPGTVVNQAAAVEKKPVVLEKRPEPILRPPPDVQPGKLKNIFRKVVFMILGMFLALLALLFWQVGKSMLSEPAVTNPVSRADVSGVAETRPLKEAGNPSRLGDEKKGEPQKSENLEQDESKKEAGSASPQKTLRLDQHHL